MGLTSIANSLGHPAIYTVTEGFASHNDDANDSQTAGFVAVLVGLLILVIQVIIIAIFGMYIWNFAVAGKDGVFPFVNKVQSVWQLIGLFILVQLFSM